MAKKHYVVWEGHKTGVFDDWGDCLRATKGFEGAKFKSFNTRDLAEKAFKEGPQNYWGKAVADPKLSPEQLRLAGKPLANSIAVDAACNSTTGQMEYQGVYTETRQLLFHQGPYPDGSNNIGEFLAIVHALAWCKKHRVDLPIYTDSHTAMTWVKHKKANTKVVPSAKNKVLFDLIVRAEAWLEENTWSNRLLKWNTAAWGEIPADFGRK